MDLPWRPVIAHHFAVLVCRNLILFPLVIALLFNDRPAGISEILQDLRFLEIPLVEDELQADIVERRLLPARPIKDELPLTDMAE